MTTQQQIDDPGQWRVGDMFEGECDGHPFSGPIWVDEVGQMLVGATYVRGRDGVIESDVTGHVTRTVEPIPEPTVAEVREQVAREIEAVMDQDAVRNGTHIVFDDVNRSGKRNAVLAIAARIARGETKGGE